MFQLFDRTTAIIKNKPIKNKPRNGSKNGRSNEIHAEFTERNDF
jgi:hypothetical protein